MAEGQAGTVTLLFTDLVDSTGLLERLGDDVAEALRRVHFRLLRDAVAAHSGREVKSLGDGLMVAFASAVDAVACAVAMQQAVRRHNRRAEESRRLSVRVGLHVGEPIRDEADYFGMPVVIARRLCESAQGGEIVGSDLVSRLVGSRGGHTFRDLGQLRLKGIAEPLSACAVVWAQPPGPAAPLLLPSQLMGGERTPFVGRGRELALLRQSWEQAGTGRRPLVLLAGEPGIGKTRLASELALALDAEGVTVLFGRSDEEAFIEYQPFVEALHFYAASCPPDELRAQVEASGPELARLLPELAERLPALAALPPAEPERERYALFESVAALLDAVSEDRPLLLVLDDLHWADKPTVLLLKHIVRSPQPTSAGPLLILGTYRETDLPRAHPLAELLADLRRERAFERVSLRGLDEDDVGALIGAWGGRSAAPALIRAVHEQTEGNPFFIEEVLRHLAETGAIQEREGRLTTDLTIAQLAIPEGVKEVIGRRLGRLSDECNSVLTIASVIGREFGLDGLERASDLASERLVVVLEEAVRARLIREHPHALGRYGFSHALIHEALYDELTTTRRVRLHGQTLQYADRDGVKLAFEVLGSSGPYLIAVGISNCPAVRTRNRPSALRWERISRSCRVVLYDRRGVGYSAAPERGYSLPSGVEDLRAVLDAAGAERALLWGAADGGPLAIAFAASYPERVAGLLLVCTTAKYTSSEDFAWGVNPVALEAFLRTDAVDRGRAVSEITRTRQSSSDADAIGEVMKRVPQRAWPKLIGGIGAADARSLLPQVRAPTLIIHDPGNSYIPVGAASYAHEQIAGSRLVLTEEAAAILFGEGLYGTIEEFIWQIDAGALV